MADGIPKLHELGKRLTREVQLYVPDTEKYSNYIPQYSKDTICCKEYLKDNNLYLTSHHN